MAKTKISRGDVRSYKQRWESAKKRMANMNKKADKVVGTVVHSMEVGGSAFAFGLIQGRKGSIEIVGVPLELGAAGLLHLAGFMELGGKQTAQHLHGLGDGALGAYMTTLGRDVGVKMKSSNKAKASGEMDGNDWPSLPSGGTQLSEQDRAVMEALNAIP